MNEQNDDRTVAMRAEMDVDNIFYMVRNEKGHSGPKYEKAKDIWMEGAERANLLYLELLHDPRVDKEYLAAIEKEMSHTNRITKQSFNKTSEEQNKGNAVPLVNKEASSSVKETVSESTSKNAKLAGTSLKKEKLSLADLARFSKKREENKAIAIKKIVEMQYI